MRTILFILLSIISLVSYGQTRCTFENIFPVTTGITKFKAMTTIASLNNIKVDEKFELHNRLLNINRWYKDEYLKGDSVFLSTLSYDYTYHNCLGGDKTRLNLRFADDKLYRLTITSDFPNSKFGKCMENYNSLIAIFKNYFTDWTEFDWKNTFSNEQIGEGYYFFPTKEDIRDNVKLNFLSIGYEVVYEYKWDDYKQDYARTGKVDRYSIKIVYYNLKGTKLTVDGY